MSIKKILWGVSALVLAAILAAYLIGNFSLKSVENAVLNNVFGVFSTENVQTSFMSFATKLTPLKRLEVAQLHQVEIFDRSSKAKLFWQKLNLPEVVVRATVPVEYNYYVDLGSDWQIRLKDQTLSIVAPALQAGTPAPDISSLKFEVRKGSFFRNETQVVQALQSEITELLHKRSKESIDLVRETARKQIESLARQWLQSETKQASIQVRFADEYSTVP